MNLFNIQKSLETKVERNWSVIYWAIDAHGTMFLPYHTHLEFYPGAVEVLRFISQRDDMKVILWTSSHAPEIRDMMKMFALSEIKISIVNDNPFEANSVRACFDEKFYFNILLDDKAGFDPLVDWDVVKGELIRLGLWCKNRADHNHIWGIDGVHSNQYCKACYTSQLKWDRLEPYYEY